jgi:UDP-glucose 4-epimerase
LHVSYPLICIDAQIDWLFLSQIVDIRMSKRILVTGGLGYIGSHTVVELVEAGYEVVVLDNLSNSNIEVKSRIESITNQPLLVEIEDVNNTKALGKIFSKYQFEGVIHFAASKAVGESVEIPIHYYHNNISGLISILGEIEKHQVSTLIFSSSCTVYGTTKDLPVTEKSPVMKADSPYGTTKIICEEIIDDYAKHKNIKAVHLRYFNPVGAHPSAKIGELPIGVPNNLIPFVTQTAAGLRDEITVFGNDYNTEDGTCIRDYIHVVDLARAHVKALDYAATMNTNVDVFNVGTGRGNSVLEVIQAFEKVNNTELKYKIGPRRAGDVEQIWSDTTKVSEILKWKPQFDLSDMMKHAWQWQKRL